MLSVFQSLRGADHWLFHQVNQVWTCSFLDKTMPVVTDLHKVRLVAFGVVPAALAYWVYRRGWAAAKAILTLVLVIGLTDSVAHRIIKPYFHRARPQKAGVETVLRTQPMYGMSFPSNHAANCFAGATFLSLVEPATAPWVFGLAVVVAYSRVYVGVHFPLDVTSGALLGLAFGLAGAFFLRRLSKPRCPPAG
ncbi:MAG: phosphatase PAP2 family protein [Elusimicrobia bacterium]|nr:phosphatase PAP2 family protein [Elusimicrobiota bacterium]